MTFLQKMRKKENEEQILMEKRKRNYSSKKDGESIRKNITSEINKLKRAETIEIKKLRELSQNKIKEYRENLFNCKKEQYLKGKSSEKIIRKNIKEFWDKKRDYFTNYHKAIKNENDQVSRLKENEIYNLERLEENLIQRLEKSQNVDEMAIQKLEEVILTPLQEFIQKYGEESKNQQSEKKKKSGKNCVTVTEKGSKAKSKSMHSLSDVKVTGNETGREEGNTNKLMS